AAPGGRQGAVDPRLRPAPALAQFGLAPSALGDIRFRRRRPEEGTMRKRSVGAAGARMGACAAMALVLAAAFAMPSQAAAPRFAAVRASGAPSPGPGTAAFRSPRMSVQVVLAPSHGARLQNLLSGLYSPKSASYRHFLAKG